MEKQVKTETAKTNEQKQETLTSILEPQCSVSWRWTADGESTYMHNIPLSKGKAMLDKAIEMKAYYFNISYYND